MSKVVDSLRMVPPQNLEAESCVLGAILLEAEALQIVKHHLDATDFYRESHRKIFRAMIELVHQHEPVDLITLSDFLKRKSDLEAVGGTAYVASLADFVPTAANVESYAKIVREKSLRRKLLVITREMEESIYSEQEDAETIAAHVSSALVQLESTQSGGFVHVGAVMIETVKRIEAAHDKGTTITGIRRVLGS